MHPILFHLPGGQPVYTYGACVALAVIVVFLASGWRCRRLGADPNVAADLIFLLFVFGVIGARAFYVMQHPDQYASSPWRALVIQEGGLVWYGGFLAASCAGILYARWRRWPVLRWCDFFAPLVAAAQAIGRAGCFFNGCCYGREVPSPWGVVFPGDSHARVPVQLIEAAYLAALTAYLLATASRRARPGEIFVRYLQYYAAGRFALEFLRGDQTTYLALSVPQWTSLFLLGAALAFERYLRRRPPAI